MNFDNLELNNYLDDDLIENYNSDLEKELADINNTVEPEWIDMELKNTYSYKNYNNNFYSSQFIELDKHIDNNRYIQLRISNVEDWFNVLNRTILMFYNKDHSLLNTLNVLDNYVAHVLYDFSEYTEDSDSDSDSDSDTKYVSLFMILKHASVLQLHFNKPNLDDNTLPLISFRVLDKNSTDVVVPLIFHMGNIFCLNNTIRIHLWYSSFYIIACSSRIDNDDIIIYGDSKQFLYYKIYEHSSNNIYRYVFADINIVHSIEDIKNRIIVERINIPLIYEYNKNYSESIKKKLRDISALNYNKDNIPKFNELLLDKKNILSDDSAKLSIYY